jgi:hypothetical protein
MKHEDIVDVDEFHLAKGEDRLPENFPDLGNLSAAFFFQFIPRPAQVLPPEFVYIPIDARKSPMNKRRLLTELTISQWNNLWEAGHLRSQFVPQVINTDFPEELKWLTKFQDVNLYLIPDDGRSKFEAFSPLYHLMPLRTLERFGLPALKRGLWPPSMHNDVLHSQVKNGFDDQLSKAFASHVWPLINSGSRIHAFSKDDPLVVLAHNLNFWLPCVYKLAEERLREFPRAEFESLEQRDNLGTIRSDLPDEVQADRPLRGGSIWRGEQEAWEATQDLVEIADEHGRLREIIDAVRTNRIEDDFSNLWSYAKEDFERKLYRKRAKVRVTFVELDKAKPVHAPTSELHEDLLWEDFMVLLNAKERRIVVCLKNGITRVSDISKKLGYANHSPISKALKQIRRKAETYFDL